MNLKDQYNQKGNCCWLWIVLILFIPVFSNAQVISSSKNPVSLEHNILFNATKRYTVTQSGPMNFNLAKMFDGNFSPDYEPGVLSITNPHVIEIADLPQVHTQNGAYIGWTTRGHTPKHFKIEGYNLYGPTANTWVFIDEVTDNAYSSTSYFKKVPAGVYSKFRLTFYETSSSLDYLGLSEIVYVHPEATIPYEGLLNLTVKNNLLPIEDWKIGSGSVSVFSQNAWPLNQDLENIRKMEEGPFGNSVLVWEGRRDDVGFRDGGWFTTYDMNHEKTYRHMVWMKRPDDLGCITQFGVQNGAANTANITGSNTNLNSANFYEALLPEIGKWYLLVGYIHSSAYTGTTHYGGLYDGETGEKIQSLTDFKNISGDNAQYQRVYQNQCSAPGDNQYFWAPRIEEITGNELPIESFLPNSGGGDQWQMADGGIYYDTGNTVGIGIDNPDVLDPAYKLMVDGVIKSREVKVSPEDWADFVFEEDYDLLTLEEVERHISENGHLPEMPSSEEVKREGIYIGEMDAKLLRKIEELTLYVIDLQEQLKIIKQEIKIENYENEK